MEGFIMFILVKYSFKCLEIKATCTHLEVVQIQWNKGEADIQLSDPHFETCQLMFGFFKAFGRKLLIITGLNFCQHLFIHYTANYIVAT